MREELDVLVSNSTPDRYDGTSDGYSKGFERSMLRRLSGCEPAERKNQRGRHGGHLVGLGAGRLRGEFMSVSLSVCHLSRGDYTSVLSKR